MHSVEPVENAAQAGRVVVGGQAIDDEAVGKIALAGDRNSLPGDRGSLGERLIARGVRGRDSRNQQRQVQEIPAVERQTANLRLRHGAGDLAARRFEHGRFSADLYLRLLCRHRERKGQLERGTHGERHRLPGFRESGIHDRDVVRTEPQVRKAEAALPIRERSAGNIRLGLPRFHARVLHDRARRIGNASAHTGGINRFLRTQTIAQNDGSNQYPHNTPPL